MRRKNFRAIRMKKNPFFFARRHEKIATNPQIQKTSDLFEFYWCGQNGIFIQMTRKFFLRTFRHQWRYLTCSSDPKLQVDTNYMRVGWIAVAYGSTSSASAKFKKSLIFRIWGFVGIFSWLCQKKMIFCIQMALKFFLRTFRHQWRYVTCYLDHKLQVDTNYMRFRFIGVAYRPISSVTAVWK